MTALSAAASLRLRQARRRGIVETRGPALDAELRQAWLDECHTNKRPFVEISTSNGRVRVHAEFPDRLPARLRKIPSATILKSGDRGFELECDSSDLAAVLALAPTHLASHTLETKL